MDSAPEDKIRPSELLSREIDGFIKHIDSLDETLPQTLVMIGLADKAATDAYMKFLSEHGQVVQKEDKWVYQLESSHFAQFTKLSRRNDRFAIARRTVPRSFIVSLISHYDFFLGRLIKSIFLLRPEMLRASERSFTLAELLEFNSFEDAKELAIEKDIETFLRKSHTEQIIELENKFQIALRKDLPIWPTFIEVTERRNLFVHTGGLISNQYLKVCKSHGCNLDEGAIVGAEISVTRSYFNEAYKAIFEMGIKLSHVLWRKVFPNDLQEADRHLSNVCYELLREEKNELAKTLLDFATTTFKRHADAKARRIYTVNRAQAYKWCGDHAKAVEIITAEDWSDTSEEFKLSVAVLTNQITEAVMIMKKIGSTGTPSKTDYRDWPLFKDFRATPEFLMAFEEVFGEPYSNIELDEAPDPMVDLEDSSSDHKSEE